MYSLKGVCHEIFNLHFFHNSNLSGPLINRLKYFRVRYQFRRDIRSQSSENSTSQCAWHSGVKNFGVANQKCVLPIFSFMIDVFTPKRISPDCPFKGNQRLTKISILTPRCDGFESWKKWRSKISWHTPRDACFYPFFIEPRKKVVSWHFNVLSFEWCCHRGL